MFHNKAAVYDLLFHAAPETMLTIAAEPRHLGARIGITAVRHTVLVQIGSTDMRVPDAAYSFQARSTAFQTAGAIRP